MIPNMGYSVASSTAARLWSFSALMAAALVIRNDTCLPYYLFLSYGHYLEGCIGLLHGGQGAINLGLDGGRHGHPE